MDEVVGSKPVEPKRIFHPFADKPSPFEEWRQTLILCLETIIQFVLWDICGNVVVWTGKSLGYVFILTPLLIAGMIAEYCRRLKNKVSVFSPISLLKATFHYEIQ
jgi:hypothetical protein